MKKLLLLMLGAVMALNLSAGDMRGKKAHKRDCQCRQVEWRRGDWQRGASFQGKMFFCGKKDFRRGEFQRRKMCKRQCMRQDFDRRNFRQDDMFWRQMKKHHRHHGRR